MFCLGYSRAKGITTGPVVAQELEEQYEKEYEAESGNKKNKFWVQGVGIPYTADIRSNDNDNRTSQNAIDEAKRLFELADTKCPGTPIVAGGYR
jgi:cutinase